MNALYACKNWIAPIAQKAWNSPYCTLAGKLTVHFAAIWGTSSALRLPLPSAGKWVFALLESQRKVLFEHRVEQNLGEEIRGNATTTRRALISTLFYKIWGLCILPPYSRVITNFLLSYPLCEASRASSGAQYTSCGELFSLIDAYKLTFYSELVQMALNVTHTYFKYVCNFSGVVLGCYYMNRPFSECTPEEREKRALNWLSKPRSLFKKEPSPEEKSEMCSKILDQRDFLTSIFWQIEPSRMQELFDYALTQKQKTIGDQKKNDQRVLILLEKISENGLDLLFKHPIGIGLPLHQVIHCGWTKSSLFLIDAYVRKGKAQRERVIDILQQPTPEGNSTFLHVAVRSRTKDAIWHILELEEADIEDPQLSSLYFPDVHEQTPMEWAFRTPLEPEILRQLCEKRTGFADKKGNTILHFAAQYNFSDKTLLEEWLVAGLDPLQKNLQGKTALDIAIEKNAETCKSVFLNYLNPEEEKTPLPQALV